MKQEEIARDPFIISLGLMLLRSQKELLKGLAECIHLLRSIASKSNDATVEEQRIPYGIARYRTVMYIAKVQQIQCEAHLHIFLRGGKNETNI